MVRGCEGQCEVRRSGPMVRGPDARIDVQGTLARHYRTVAVDRRTAHRRPVAPYESVRRVLTRPHTC
jgi:hypothetical protein